MTALGRAAMQHAQGVLDRVRRDVANERAAGEEKVEKEHGTAHA